MAETDPVMCMIASCAPKVVESLDATDPDAVATALQDAVVADDSETTLPEAEATEDMLPPVADGPG